MFWFQDVVEKLNDMQIIQKKMREKTTLTE